MRVVELILIQPVNRGAMINLVNMYVEPITIVVVIGFGFFLNDFWYSISSIMMTHLMLNLRDPQLNGRVEEFKTTTVNIRGFSGQAETGTINGYSRNVHGDEGSV
jgi:hypothetical protein